MGLCGRVGVGRLERLCYREEEVSATLHVSSYRLRELPCLILVGGLGTRLRPVLCDMPKPMAPIAGRPFLEYLVRWLRCAGVVEITLCTGYRADKIQEFFQSGERLGVRINYSLEQEPLGTWGAIRQAAKDLRNSNFLVLNGDSWLQVDLHQLFDFHLRARGIATIAAADVGDASRFGSIQVDGSWRIVQFTEKQTRDSGLVNGGVYVFSRDIVANAPTTGVSLEKDIFPVLVPHGIYAMPVRGYFVDIGVPEEYKRLQGDAKNWIERLALPEVGGGTC